MRRIVFAMAALGASACAVAAEPAAIEFVAMDHVRSVKAAPRSKGGQCHTVCFGSVPWTFQSDSLALMADDDMSYDYSGRYVIDTIRGGSELSMSCSMLPVVHAVKLDGNVVAWHPALFYDRMNSGSGNHVFRLANRTLSVNVEDPDIVRKLQMFAAPSKGTRREAWIATGSQGRYDSAHGMEWPIGVTVIADMPVDGQRRVAAGRIVADLAASCVDSRHVGPLVVSATDTIGVYKGVVCGYLPSRPVVKGLSADSVEYSGYCDDLTVSLFEIYSGGPVSTWYASVCATDRLPEISLDDWYVSFDPATGRRLRNEDVFVGSKLGKARKLFRAALDNVCEEECIDPEWITGMNGGRKGRALAMPDAAIVPSGLLFAVPYSDGTFESVVTVQLYWNELDGLVKDEYVPAPAAEPTLWDEY